MVSRDELDAFKNLERRPGPTKRSADATPTPSKSDAATGSKARWPRIEGRGTNSQTEAVAEFPKHKSWENRQYKNLKTALVGNDGVAKLFTGRSKNGVERKCGLCQFFAAAKSGHRSIIASVDGKTFYLLDRADFDDLPLREISVAAMKMRCAAPAPAKSAADL